jgi:hypothetical protein
MLSNKYFNMLNGNIDSFGVITQNAQDNWDGGDTTQREGMFLCAMWYHLQANRVTQNDFEWSAVRYLRIIDRLNYGNGRSLRRHPDPSKWYHDPNRMSRDQLTSNICALGYVDQNLLKQIMLKNLLRMGLFATNTRENGATQANSTPMTTWQYVQYFLGWRPSYPVWGWSLPDLTDPSIWGAYIRGLNWRVLWPLLLLTDLVNLVNALIILYETKQGTATDDQLSQQMLLLQSVYRMPTPVSKLAMRLYKKTNPMNSLNEYFAPANDGPAMNEIYQEIWDSQ